MEAVSVDEPPTGPGWQYEPKWDGFRCVAFRDGDQIFLQSKSGQPLARYFPDLVESLRSVKALRFVVDGEIVIPISGRLSFDDLLLRVHPAASRVRKLAAEHPALLIVFDLLLDERGRSLRDLNLADAAPGSNGSRHDTCAAKVTSGSRRRRTEWSSRNDGSKPWAEISTASLPSASMWRIAREREMECKRSSIDVRPTAWSAVSVMRKTRRKGKKPPARCCSGSTTTKGC